jgi:hypothetical protein
MMKCCHVWKGTSVDHKRVYEKEGLWSWYFVLVIQVTEVWLL